jgi:hypothetical protein
MSNINQKRIIQLKDNIISTGIGRKAVKMSTAVKELGRVELINLERLAYILKGLSAAELETLALLLDEEASKSIRQSLKELEEGKGLPIDEW